MKRQTDPYGQGDEEVNKRIKQKIYIFKQIAQYFAQYFGFFGSSSGAKRKMEIKLNVRYKQEFEDVSMKTIDCYWYRRLGGIIYQ